MRQRDVLAALSTLGIDDSCPVCGNDSWRGIGDDDQERDVKLVALDEAGQFLESPDGPGPPWLGLKCVVLTCRRCGWVRLHSLETVRRLLAHAETS